MPFDVWWFRVPAPERVVDQVLPISGKGRLFVVIPREGYVQIANTIKKGTDASLRARGIESLRSAVAAALPALQRGVAQLELDDVKLLDVRVARLTRWFAHGLLCIGDAAHAMSPVGGVGVNLAVQDRVAAARMLAGPLARGRVDARELRAVQRWRMLPAVVTQAVQGLLHRALRPAIEHGSGSRPARALRLVFEAVPALSAAMARLIGVGIRPEHAPGWARR